MTGRRIVVCGGGLAGISAACEAALLGADVTLVERRPFLGGKAFSFDHEGLQVDNGQHVFLGCCTAYRDLLRLLGVAHLTHLQAPMAVPIRDRAGRQGTLRDARMPAPLHMLPSFVTYPLLTTRQKLAALRALSAIARMAPSARDRLDDVTFGEWLADHGQCAQAIANFWDVIVLPTCNERSDRVSAALALYVVQEGFFRRRGGAAVGWSRVGLTELIDPAARRFLARHHVRLITDAAVVGAGGDEVTLSTGEILPADGVVLALTPQRVRQVCPGALGPIELGEAPIVNVHVWFDRPVMDDDFIAVVDSPVQWVFNRSRLTGSDEHQVAVSISGAHAELAMSKREVTRLVCDELCALFPAAAEARVVRSICVKEPAATFDPGPGQARRRPGARTPVEGVTLAGAWTDTRWPATMEGAVRSGLLAARALVSPDVDTLAARPSPDGAHGSPQGGR